MTDELVSWSMVITLRGECKIVTPRAFGTSMLLHDNYDLGRC